MTNRTTTRRVTVAAPSRLHLGFLDIGGRSGRHFGSIGLALEQPLTRLHLRSAERVQVTGPDADRVAEYANLLLRQFELDSGVAITVDEVIPAHTGLGSGTQLALAVGLGIARLYGLPLTTRDVAGRLQRGARSGIGIGAFDQGGFLVDGGRTVAGEPPPLVCRLMFPEHWRVLLLFDDSLEGASGDYEKQAFVELPPFTDQQSGELCRRVLMQMLPALVEQDIVAFGEAVTEVQRRIGDYFAPAQGGRYTSDRVAAALAFLQRRGVTGVGQSSWGPTGFAFCASDAEAERHRAALAAEDNFGLRVGCYRARNRSGRIECDSEN